MPQDWFYKSHEWKALRIRCLKRDRWTCVNCGASVRALGQSRVNHKLSRKQRPDLALSLSNLETLCVACDNAHHSEKGGHDRAPTQADGMPTDPAHHWNKGKT